MYNRLYLVCYRGSRSYSYNMVFRKNASIIFMVCLFIKLHPLYIFLKLHLLGIYTYILEIAAAKTPLNTVPILGTIQKILLGVETLEFWPVRSECPL